MSTEGTGMSACAKNQRLQQTVLIKHHEHDALAGRTCTSHQNSPVGMRRLESAEGRLWLQNNLHRLLGMCADVHFACVSLSASVAGPCPPILSRGIKIALRHGS